jgi:hypothetical protein
MTITSQTTRQGKVIHLLSPTDLGDAVAHGERLRAYCPIHGGDHQRSLSIDASSGWGFCHCCHATVLIQDNRTSSPYSGSRQMRRQHCGLPRDAPNPSPGADPLASFPPHPPSFHVHAAITVPRWQREEVTALTTLVPLMQKALGLSNRVQAYLHERGIPLAVAKASGMSYLSRAVWEQAVLPVEQKTLLQRWIGRIIFSLHSPAGQGYIGRTLLGWEPGMDENAHKALLDHPGALRRWIKTNPAGWFGFEEPGCLASQVVLVEGGFDRLVLLAAGLPTNTVVALVGTAARPGWLMQFAPQVKQVVLALDADDSGMAAMERLANEFRQAGLRVMHRPPPHDEWGKDWSERWRRLGPQSVWPLYDILAQNSLPLHERR